VVKGKKNKDRKGPQKAAIHDDRHGGGTSKQAFKKVREEDFNPDGINHRGERVII